MAAHERTIQITIPVEFYQRLQKVAEQSQRTVEEVLIDGALIGLTSLVELNPIPTPDEMQREFIQNSPVAFERLEAELTGLFTSGRLEIFEDGFDSTFALDLIGLIEKHGTAALRVIEEQITSGKVDGEVASEALRRLADVDQPETYAERLGMLQKGLESSSHWVRDGALIGLSSMDDPQAIPAVKGAIEREPLPILRKFMQQTLIQLEETQAESAK